jgi:hypothetical protein
MAYAATYYFKGVPDWQADVIYRFRVSLLLAAVLVLAGLSVLKIPLAGDPLPITELVVRLIERVAERTALPDSAAEQAVPAAPQPDVRPAEPAAAGAAKGRPVPDAAELELPVEVQIVDDWHEFGSGVVREFIANQRAPYSVNPVFDEKRRLAASKFRPSAAPAKRGPWDDVEQDQIGRTILNLGGGCFRVLDDPSAVYRDIFETYTQFVVQCTIAFGRRRGTELPWVNEIRSRYAYLRLREEQRTDPYAF